MGNLQNQLFSSAGNLLFAYGLHLVRLHFLNVSWRRMLAFTTVLLISVDSIFTFCTIFDVVRNQYFFLGETVLLELPMAANFVVSVFVIVEMADNGNEALVYGLLTTAGNLGNPVARAVGNQLFGMFRPSLSDANNYIADTDAFRWLVAGSYALSYSFGLLALLTLFLLPWQKVEARRRVLEWPHRNWYAVVSTCGLVIVLAYALTADMMAINENTMCRRFAGGQGCDRATPEPGPGEFPADAAAPGDVGNRTGTSLAWGAARAGSHDAFSGSAPRD